MCLLVVSMVQFLFTLESKPRQNLQDNYIIVILFIIFGIMSYVMISLSFLYPESRQTHYLIIQGSIIIIII